MLRTALLALSSPLQLAWRGVGVRYPTPHDQVHRPDHPQRRHAVRRLRRALAVHPRPVDRPGAGLRRYVQSHLVNDLGPEYPQAFDGMSEAWFEDLDAFVKAFRSDAWAAAVEDVPNFMRDRGKWLLTTEVPIIDAYPTARERESFIKYAGFLHMKRGLSYEQFAHHWRDIHGPLVAAEFTGMVRYVQSHAAARDLRRRVRAGLRRRAAGLGRERRDLPAASRQAHRGRADDRGQP